MRGRSANVRASLAALLFVVGALGGAIGGGTAGLMLGRRSAAPAPPRPVPPPVSAPPSVPHPPTSPAAKDAGPTAVPDAGVASKTVEVCVEVRDGGGRLVPGALINVRALPNPNSSVVPTGGEKKDIGELGVYSASLPFPEDVIAGSATPLGRAALAPSGAQSGPRSDDHGRACLPLLAPGYYGLTAVKDERTASIELSLPVAVPAAAAPFTVVLRLGEPLDALCRLTTPPPLPGEDFSEPISEALGPDVAGRVVDGRGFGLAAVRLEAQVGAGRARAVGVSDSAGSFRLTGLPRGSLSLRAQLNGYAPLVLSRRTDEPRGELQLVLKPGGGIAGTLRDARRGNLPAGAQLFFVSATDGQSVSVPLSADGSFSLTGLPVGAATLRARAPGHAPLSRAVQLAASESPGQLSLRDLRLELEASGSLSGQVRGPVGGAAGISIQVYGEDGNLAGKTLTDERGEFRLAELPAGHLRISATSSQGRGESTVDLRPGGEERVYLELRP